MQKQKTASIGIYQIFGTKSGICADITYRGKLLTYVEGVNLDAIHATARTWARNRGFTHVKMTYDIQAFRGHKCTVRA